MEEKYGTKALGIKADQFVCSISSFALAESVSIFVWFDLLPELGSFTCVSVELNVYYC